MSVVCFEGVRVQISVEVSARVEREKGGSDVVRGSLSGMLWQW